DGEAEKIKRTKSAEASAMAMAITARGIAESRSIIAEGNAKALAAFRQDTTLTDEDAMAFMMEINRLEAWRDAGAHGGRTVLVTGDGQSGALEAKALLAGLAGDSSIRSAAAAAAGPTPTLAVAQDAGADGRNGRHSEKGGDKEGEEKE